MYIKSTILRRPLIKECAHANSFIPEMIKIAVDYINSADFLTKKENEKIRGKSVQRILSLI